MPAVPLESAQRKLNNVLGWDVKKLMAFVATTQLDSVVVTQELLRGADPEEGAQVVVKFVLHLGAQVLLANVV